MENVTLFLFLNYLLKNKQIWVNGKVLRTDNLLSSENLKNGIIEVGCGKLGTVVKMFFFLKVY